MFHRHEFKPSEPVVSDLEKDKLIADLQRRLDELERRDAAANVAPSFRIEGFEGIKALDDAIQRRELGPFLDWHSLPVSDAVWWTVTGLIASPLIIMLGIAFFA